jgi:hypothetical protein
MRKWNKEKGGGEEEEECGNICKTVAMWCYPQPSLEDKFR